MNEKSESYTERNVYKSGKASIKITGSQDDFNELMSFLDGATSTHRAIQESNNQGE